MLFSGNAMELYADMDAITMKKAVSILKESLTDVLFYFSGKTLEICGADPEKVSISKVILTLTNIQMESPTTIAACLQDINKFLRGVEKQDGLIITIEPGEQLAFRIVSSTADRNTWYKFPRVGIAKDRMVYNIPETPSQVVTVSSRLVQKTLKEIVHGHDLVTIKLQESPQAFTFQTFDNELGGGKTSIFPDQDVTISFKNSYLVRYLQKLLHVIQPLPLTFQFYSVDSPLVLSYSVNENFQGWMAMCPQTEE